MVKLSMPLVYGASRTSALREAKRESESPDLGSLGVSNYYNFGL